MRSTAYLSKRFFEITNFAPVWPNGKAQTFEDALQWEVKQIEKSLGEGGLLGSMACRDWPLVARWLKNPGTRGDEQKMDGYGWIDMDGYILLWSFLYCTFAGCLWYVMNPLLGKEPLCEQGSSWSVSVKF